MSQATFSWPGPSVYHSATGTDKLVAYNNRSNAFPGFARSPDGDLICAYYTNPYFHNAMKSLHLSSGEIRYRVSSDGGVTWSKGYRLVSGGVFEYRGVEITEVAPGRYVAVFEQDALTTVVTRTIGVYISRGSWDGTNKRIVWSKPIAVTPSPDSTWNYASDARVAVLESGRWLLPHYRYRRSIGNGDGKPRVAISDDEGQSWTFYQISGDYGTETFLEVVGGNSIRAWVRSTVLTYYDSTDGGITWSSGTVMTPTNWVESRPNIARLPSGEYFLMYRKGSSPTVADTSYVLSTGGRSSWGTPVELSTGFFLYASFLPTPTGVEGVYAALLTGTFDSAAVTPSKCTYFSFDE